MVCGEQMRTAVTQMCDEDGSGHVDKAEFLRASNSLLRVALATLQDLEAL